MDKKINLTFSGAGFLALYQIGVASCFKYYGRKLLDKVSHYGGCSAGAMCAVGLLCDIDLEHSVLLFMDAACKVRDGALGPLAASSLNLGDTIRKVFSVSLPSNAYKMASGKVFISLTRISDWENVIVSEFDSNRDLIDALVCTSFIPFYCGVQPPKYRGVSYIDGGFTDNLLQHFDGNTITVSVFSGDSDICPSDGQKDNSLFDMNNVTVQFNGHNIYRLISALFPPDNTSLTELCRQGFKDAMKYLYSKYPDMLSIDVDIISVPQCNRGCYGDEDGCYGDKEYLMCHCGGENEEGTGFGEREKAIGIDNAVKSLIFPQPIYELLSKAEQVSCDRDLLHHVTHTMLQVAKWLACPSYYITIHIYLIINEMFHILMPMVERYNSDNIVVQKLLKTAEQAFHAYNNSKNFEWHPSLDIEQKSEIVKTRNRILSAERSFVAVRKSITNCESVVSLPRTISVSSDGSDIPRDIRPKGWSVLSDDVFEKDEPTTNTVRTFSSSSVAFLMKAGSAIIDFTSKECDYGDDLDYENMEDGIDGEDICSDSGDENDHLSPIYF